MESARKLWKQSIVLHGRSIRHLSDLKGLFVCTWMFAIICNFSLVYYCYLTFRALDLHRREMSAVMKG